MVDIDWEVAQWLALGQLICVVIFGYIFGLLTRFRSPESPSCRYFRLGEYSPSYEEDPEVVFKTIPSWFRFVRVEYDDDNQVIRETFISFFGDVTALNYLEENRLRIESNFYANNFLFIFPALGLGLLVLSKFFTSSIVTVFVGDQSSLSLLMAKYGITLFFSVFLSAPIKLLCDFANSLKWFKTQSESNT